MKIFQYWLSFSILSYCWLCDFFVSLASVSSSIHGKSYINLNYRVQSSIVGKWLNNWSLPRNITWYIFKTLLLRQNMQMSLPMAGAQRMKPSKVSASLPLTRHLVLRFNIPYQEHLNWSRCRDPKPNTRWSQGTPQERGAGGGGKDYRSQRGQGHPRAWLTESMKQGS